MKYNKIISCALSLAFTAALLPTGASAADKELCTITLLDFSGKSFATLQGYEGDKVDLDSVDTSVLDDHIGDYTQVGFSSWSETPDTFTKDISISALYQKRTISLEGIPKKQLYNSLKGNIDLTGLSVKITSETQIPEKNDKGEFLVTTEVLEITDKCTCEPATPAEAFAESGETEIKVYPIITDRPILTFFAGYIPDSGDTDGSGTIDASDASNIMICYAAHSTGETVSLSDEEQIRYDVDLNGIIDSADASAVLTHYAISQTGETPDWYDILD